RAVDPAETTTSVPWRFCSTVSTPLEFVNVPYPAAAHDVFALGAEPELIFTGVTPESGAARRTSPMSIPAFGQLEKFGSKVGCAAMPATACRVNPVVGVGPMELAAIALPVPV